MNENTNEAMVAEQTTSTENEIKATIDKYAGLHSDDLNEEQLREFCEALRSLAAMKEFERNELIAEREALTKQNEELQAKLKEEKENALRFGKYWREEEDKVKALKLLIRSIPISSYVTAKDILTAMVENI